MSAGLLVIALWLMVIVVPVRGAAVRVTIHADKTHYVLQEPLRFRIAVSNDSNSEVRIPSIRDLGAEMRFMYFEVTVGDETKLHKIHVFTSDRVQMRYIGEPLQPGDSVVTFLYPHDTDQYGEDARHPDHDLMFPSAGQYTVRVFLKTGLLYPELWQPDDPLGEPSNALVLEFRRPSTSERAILQACWSKRSVGAALGEMNAHAAFDESALRKVIAEYPDDPLIVYAEFALARTLTRVDRRGSGPKAPEGIRLLEEIRREHPEFRRAEVTKQLATAYFFEGDREASVSVFEEGLRENPILYDNYSYMARYIHARTGDPNAPWRWSVGRMKGKRLPDFMEE